MNANLLLLPFAGHPSTFGLRSSRQRHDFLPALASEPFDGRLIWVIACIRVLTLLQTSDEIELLWGELLIFLCILVKGTGPEQILVKHSL
jgi:hypothetical protein